MKSSSKLNDFRIVGIIFIIGALIATAVYAVGMDKVITQSMQVKNNTLSFVEKQYSNLVEDEGDETLLPLDNTTESTEEISVLDKDTSDA